MAKCAMCNVRKGKRKCLIVDGLICSLCCGKRRTEQECSTCIFYQPSAKFYEKVPAYSTIEMEEDLGLQVYSDCIEGAICEYDDILSGMLKDRHAIRIVELLLDRYHFQDQDLNPEDAIIANGVRYVEKKIDKKLKSLKDFDNEKLVKVLSVIRFVAKRRTRSGREHLEVLHEFL